MVQIQELVSRGYRVSLEETANGYEVTVFASRHEHAHYGGTTLAEAINRASHTGYVPPAMPNGGADGSR